jgi:hypothetical protein
MYIKIEKKTKSTTPGPGISTQKIKEKDADTVPCYAPSFHPPPLTHGIHTI